MRNGFLILRWKKMHAGSFARARERELAIRNSALLLFFYPPFSLLLPSLFSFPAKLAL